MITQIQFREGTTVKRLMLQSATCYVALLLVNILLWWLVDFDLEKIDMGLGLIGYSIAFMTLLSLETKKIPESIEEIENDEDFEE